MERGYVKQLNQGINALDVPERYKKSALENIKQWLTESEFKDYREQIIFLIKNKQFELLLNSFYQVIPFGTGGRRGPVGIGTNRINPYTIKASAQGHADYLLKKYPDAKQRGIVIEYDVRKYPDTGIYSDKLSNPVKGITSKDLAICAADVYTANGIKVFLFNDFRTTPELSFAIRYLNAAAGVNISASHNPVDYNAKKVYSDDGGQLIPPEDQILLDTVNDVKHIKDKRNSKLIKSIGTDVDEAYINEVKKLSIYPSERSARILYTPLHGTGSTNVFRALKALDFDVIEDEATKKPDGAFPNVKFNIPNPEVPECFETCYNNPQSKHSDIIISSDPDADRLGLSVFHKNKWHYFNGTEIALVLLEALLDAYKKQGRLNKYSTVATTLVTSSLIREICNKYHVRVIDDLLVGFKYIGNEILKLEKQGHEYDFIIGLEESHGYLIGTYCRDKDAAGAAVIISELASSLKGQGKTIVDFLENIYNEYGYADNLLTSIIFASTVGTDKINNLQTTLRKHAPDAIGNFKVIKFIDRWGGQPHLSDTDTASRNVLVFQLKPPDGIALMKLIIRPSGTEPKTKIYIEVIGKKGTKREHVIDARKSLRKSFLNVVYPMLGIKIPERGFELSDLLPVETKLKYFDIENQLLALKKQFAAGKLNKQQYKDQIDHLLKPFGSDPIEKIDACFTAKYKKPFREYFNL